ncbi:MAG: TFIIB-type zinc ribbon-containing protein [Euryarchaeota archaeon]|nr:TFIIB-type zinc ribbon-containing protein [Euryarchaeota archaeon]MDE1836781.1 TFIIB-type zinc ribbon-containing protein [Euryarchaeota archaeon]MDE1879799.1 TFIIB-type zinc ribbon-containing protein [Euryarchaeota archaeon]MDE2044765.1 TFIIB-type zinc ribbon-containing protein [Thermoplasmata archaeon]
MPVRRRPRGPSILLCPKCLSPEVDRDPLLFGGTRYRCRRCGYEGALVLEKDARNEADTLEGDEEAP